MVGIGAEATQTALAYIPCSPRGRGAVQVALKNIK
jgi:hypothetical protein